MIKYTFKNNVISLIGILTLLYLIVLIFFIELPKAINILWKNEQWWKFTIAVGVCFLGIYCLFSILLDELVVEISNNVKKTLLQVLAMILLALLAGVFNESIEESITITIIIAFFSALFYFIIDVKLSSITDFSYAKGWFDGYKNNINDYGKTYDEGFEEGKNFKIQEQNKSLVLEEYPLENEERKVKTRLEVLKVMAFKSFKEKQKKGNSSK